MNKTNNLSVPYLYTVWDMPTPCIGDFLSNHIADQFELGGTQNVFFTQDAKCVVSKLVTVLYTISLVDSISRALAEKCWEKYWEFITHGLLANANKSQFLHVPFAGKQVEMFVPYQLFRVSAPVNQVKGKFDLVSTVHPVYTEQSIRQNKILLSDENEFKGITSNNTSDGSLFKIDLYAGEPTSVRELISIDAHLLLQAQYRGFEPSAFCCVIGHEKE